MRAVESALESGQFNTDVCGSENDKKLSLDQAFKDVLIKLVEGDSSCNTYKGLVNLSCEAVKQELCNPTTPFVMLSDLMDCNTLDKCEVIFELVEEKVELWKSEMFYNSGRNYLLRMCNDILKRLSKSQNTVFCGRIQQFLARLFPLSEKSGLNLMSEFNLGNVTHYMTKPEEYDRSRKMSLESERDKEGGMEVEEGETVESEDTSPITIDYNLYWKFWSIQDFFRKPVQCYDKLNWKTFVSHSDEVMSCFESFKLDNSKTSRRKAPKNVDESKKHDYFAKYLTSEKLLDLQLSDSNFRRYVLTQFLILFHYLNATVKFKNATQTLSEEQLAWVKKMSDRIYAILGETPPEGSQFQRCLTHILHRENNWNMWKNEGCQSYVRDKAGPAVKAQDRRAKKRSIGDDIKASGGKIVKMGNAELTRLWNQYPNNMEACRSAERIYVPTVLEFFEESIEQADPEQMVEDEYKLVRNPTFQWKALRILSRKSPHFFTQTIHPEKTLQEYLEKAINKISKEMPTHAGGDDMKTELDEEQDDKEDNTHDEDNLDRHEENKEDEEEVILASKEQLIAMSEHLGASWKTLAVELNLPEDEITYFESSSTSVRDQALTMLTVWKDNEGDRATPGTLQTALREIGQVSVATEVFGQNE